MTWVGVGVAVGVGGLAVGLSAAKSDREAAEAQSLRASDAIRTATRQARADVNRLFPQAQQARLQGFQGAQDVFANVVPQQFGAFQQGNIQAQQTTGLAPQQIQNALLGLPVDFGFLQPQQQFQPDFSFLNQPINQQPIDIPPEGLAPNINLQLLDQLGLSGAGGFGSLFGASGAGGGGGALGEALGGDFGGTLVGTQGPNPFAKFGLRDINTELF